MPAADQIHVSSSLQDVATAVGLKKRDLGVAELREVKNWSRQHIAKELRLSVREVMHALHRFAMCYKAARMDPLEALKALNGKFDDQAHYLPVVERYDRRLSAMTKAMEGLKQDLERKAVIVDAVVDALIANVGRYEPRPYKMLPLPKDKGRPHYTILELSDWQFGSKWLPADVAGLGEASTPILMERVRLLGQRVLHLTNLQRQATNLPWLVINWLGDMIEGEVIFKGQGAYIDMGAADQMTACQVAAEELLLSLLPYYDRIICNCVTGNHGRMSNRKGEQHPRNNWDRMLYLFLARRFADEPRLIWRISTHPWMAYTLPTCERFNHVILHGDEIPSNLGIPFYGINREIAKMATLANMPVHYVHLGHFHSPSALDNVYGMKIMNGALTGPSPFSTGPLKTGSAPQQWFMGFHPRWGLVWKYPVYLAEMPELQADDQGVYTPYETGV